MEQILIKGTSQKSKALRIILIAAVVIIVMGIALSFITYTTGTYYVRGTTAYNPISGENFSIPDKYEPYNERYEDFLAFFVGEFGSEAYGYVISVGVVAVIYYVVLYLRMNQSEITVTNMRIRGKSNYGKQVDLPLAQIASMTKCGFSGIAVSTSSGKKKFWLIDNQDDVYNAISRAMADVQNTQEKTKSSSEENNADSLKQFKELLDAGVISQEEFDLKKKQLLGF